jgi:hypothetical protein
MPTQTQFCSDLSVQSQEATIGTATPTSAYLLLEYPHAWGAKAIPESTLPDAVKNWFEGHTQTHPDLKALLIRRERPATESSGIHFFIAAARERDPALYAFQLERYQDLLSLDVPAILAGDRSYESHRSADPLLLVCTHGRRDACCARDGRPVYQALTAAAAQDAPGAVWQISHIGGHRFAANLVCLPHGLLYGRVDPQAALLIMDEYRQGRMVLPNLRGRSCYPGVVQAAEYHLRNQSGERGVCAYQCIQSIQTSPGMWQVRFSSADQATEFQLDLRVEGSGTQVYVDCKMEGLTRPTNYQLVDFRFT